MNLQPAGDCFAQAATDLINFRGKEQLSSAYLGNKARLAREIAKRGSKSLTFGYTGGQPIDVLAISNEKACPEGIITDSESLFGATNKGILRNSINDFEKYFVQIHKGKITGYETTNQEELVRVYNESKQAPVSYNCFKNNISLMFPMIRDFREVAKIITETDNISLAYSKIADLNCQKYLVHVEPPVKPVSYYYDGLELYNQVPLSTQFSKPIKTTDSKQQFMINKINERLNLKQPLVISYLTGNSLGIKGNSMHTAHASVVVGRKWNKETKQCMYEIRNSWGTDWKPPMNATAKPSKHKGHFLISEKDLKQDMFGVTYDNQIF